MNNVDKSKGEDIKYWIALTIESIGAIMILIKGIPLYKTLLLHYETYAPKSGGMYIAVLVILLIQVPHWYKQNKWSIPIVPKSNILSTLIAFIGRIFFIFAAAFFSVLFFIRYDGWEGVHPYKIILMLTVIFSIFCYCRDLEDLAEDFKVRKIRD